MQGVLRPEAHRASTSFRGVRQSMGSGSLRAKTRGALQEKTVSGLWEGPREALLGRGAGKRRSWKNRQRERKHPIPRGVGWGRQDPAAGLWVGRRGRRLLCRFTCPSAGVG